MANFDATTPLLQGTKALVDAYFSRDFSKVEPLLSKDFKYRTYPEVDHHPVETKEEHIRHYGQKFASFPNVEPIVHEVIEAPGKVVLHFTARWFTADGDTIDYNTLCILSFVVEDGRLMLFELKDFADPEKRTAYHGAAEKTLAGQGGLVA